MKREAVRRHTHLLLRIPFVLFAALALFATVAYAQGGASIVGTVADPTGAVVPNAKITVTDTNNGFVYQTQSNGTGNFKFAGLPNGQYNLKVEAPSFKTYEEKSVVLHVGDVRRVDAALQLGVIGQTVTVESAALQVQTDTNVISQTVTSNQISNLATNGRNILQLTALVPGAASNMPDFDKPGAQFQNRAIQFNGMRSDNNNWLIDGGEAYDRGGGGILVVAPSQDAIGEFTIATSNYSADQGNSSGGMTSMALKSGTRRFHASAWEYNRNDAMNSYNYFAKHTTGTIPKKGELRYNVFGFNAGGPVQFRSNNPKTFFFYNQEWRREISGLSPINSKAFTAAEQAGNMEGLNKFIGTGNAPGTQLIWVPQVTDPAAIAKYASVGLHPGDPFPNNTIPAGLIDSNAAAYLKAGYFPTPNQSDGLYYYKAAVTTDFVREEIARVDHQFNDKYKLFGHLIWDSLSEGAPQVSWSGNPYDTIGSIETVPSWAGVVHFAANFTPHLLNEIAFNENGNDITIDNTNLWKAPAGWAPTPLFASANPKGKIPSINVQAGGGPIGANMGSGNWPWQNWWRSNQIKDDLSYIHGSHSFKAGFAWMWTSKKQQIFVDTAGNYTFNGAATGCDPAKSTFCPNGKSQSGIGLADFLLGYASNINQPQLQDAVNIHFNTINAYLVDDWRLNRRLTLNLGIRWEALPHAYDVNGRMSNFYPYLFNPNNAANFAGTPNAVTGKPNTSVLCSSATQSGCTNPNLNGFSKVSGIALSDVLFYMNGIGLAGRNGIPKSLTINHVANIAPRLGFAFDVFGDQKTVLRGGAGINYERNAGNEEYNMGANLPFSNSTSTSTVYLANPTTSYLDGTSAGAAPKTTQGFTGVQSNLPISTVYQYNLQIQEQLRSNMVATIGYVGNKSSHLSDQRNYNLLPLNDLTNRVYVCGPICGSTAGNGINADPFRQYQGWNNLTILEDEGNAHYHGLQATLRASGWHNLSFGALYTFSHAWDQLDGQIFANLSNPYNPAYDNGTAGFDRRHIGSVNFDYNIPIFQHSHGIAKTVLAGWTVSGIGSMMSGNPINIGSPDWTGLAGITNRPNQISPVTYVKTHNPAGNSKWFDPSAFSKAAPMTIGTSGKNQVKGIGRDNWNISLYKDFRFTEQAGFQFRAESFNTFNHTQFNTVDGGVVNGASVTAPNNNTTAGNMTGTYDPRVFQLGAKIYF
jgi:hypothetical protein